LGGFQYSGRWTSIALAAFGAGEAQNHESTAHSIAEFMEFIKKIVESWALRP
jgi:hypothetical protein